VKKGGLAKSSVGTLVLMWGSISTTKKERGSKKGEKPPTAAKEGE